MIIQKRGFTTIIIIVLIIASINLFLFFNKESVSYSSLSGMITKGISENFQLNLPLMAFIAQWVILLIIIFTAGIKFLKHRKKEETSIKEAYPLMNHKKKKSETDLDVFYNILKEKKELSTGTISRLFKIQKEKALEWGKILEDHELAIIEYPAFDDPEVKINTKTIEVQEKKPEEKAKQEKTKKEEKITKTSIPITSKKIKPAPKSKKKKKNITRKKTKKRK